MKLHKSVTNNGYNFIRKLRNCDYLGCIFYLKGYRSQNSILIITSCALQYVWVIDQVRGQDGWILAKFFFSVFMDRDEVDVHKLAKKKKNEANIQPS